MKKIAIIAAALAIAAVSCEKDSLEEPKNENIRTYTACVPDDGTDTKTVLDGKDGKTVRWKQYDDFYLLYWSDNKWNFSTSSISTKSISEDGKMASIPSSNDITWALTPSPSSSSGFYTYNSCSDDKVSINLKYAQYSSSFSNANIMVAKASGTKLNFQHVCGIFCVTVGPETAADIQTIIAYGPGIVGPVEISEKDGNINVETPATDECEIQSSTYGISGKVYFAVRPGTYKAGELGFKIYGSGSKMIGLARYDKDITVTPGMLVNWGDIYRDHKDNDIVLVPYTYINDIGSAAGKEDNVKEIAFVADSPGEAGVGETRINPSASGPAIYVSSSFGKVTLRTPAKKFYNNYWSFYNFPNLEAVTGLENIEFRGVNTFAGMFRNTKLKSFDFSKVNSFNTIGDMSNMFDGCKNLEEVDLRGLDLSNVYTMASMFSGCSSLQRAYFSGADLSGLTTTYNMFNACKSLVEVQFTGTITRDIQSMREMFHNCTTLTTVDMSSFNTPQLLNLSDMFWKCTLLQSINLSSFNTEKLTSAGSMFSGCESITNIDLSNFHTPSLTSCGAMFDGCESLTNIDISHFNTSQVGSFYWMFRGCSKLTKLDLRNFDTSSAVSFDSMFDGCHNLVNLDISSFTTPMLQDCKYMFSSASALKTLDLSNFDMSKITDMRRMFDGTLSLSTLILGKKFSFQGNFEKVFGYSLMGSNNKSTPYYTSIQCSDGLWNVITEILGTNISHYEHVTPPLALFMPPGNLRPAFKKAASKLADPGAPVDITYGVANGNDRIKTITFVPYSLGAKKTDEEVFSTNDSAYPIYGSVDSNGNMTIRTPGPGFKMNPDSRYFFSSNTAATGVSGSPLSALTQINGLENVSTDGVTQMQSMFSKCSSLTEVDLSNFSTSSVTSFQFLFNTCSSLTSADLSSFTVSSGTGCGSMFLNCTSLTSVNMISFNTTVGSFGSMFKGCTHLANLTLGPKLRGVGTSVFTDMGTANTGLTYWTEVTCGEHMKSILQDEAGDNYSHYHWISND